MDVDKALTKLGRWGSWQRRGLILVSLSANIVLALNMLSIVFMGVVPPHFCMQHGNDSLTDNTSYTGALEQCSVFENNTNTSSACAHGWHYTLSHGSTIVSEWDLVCSKNYYVDLSQTVFMIGLGVSDIFVTMVADYFGRKKAHVGSAVLSGVLGIVLSFVPNYTAFVAVRFLMAIAVDGVYCTGQVWISEHFAVQNRVLANSISLFFWPLGLWLLNLIAYLIPNWRYLSATIGIICIVPVSYIWLLDESIPWLEATQKFKESQAVLNRACRLNNIPVVQRDDLSDNKVMHLLSGNSNQVEKDKATVEKEIEHVQRDNLISIIRHQRLCLYSLIFVLLWFTCNVAYYGILLGAGSLAGNLHVNYMIFGAMEILSAVSVLVSSKWFGRRPVIIIGQLAVGIGLIVSEFIPQQTESGVSLVPLILVIVMIGYGGTAAAFADICVYTPEVYPTHVRNSTFGIAMTFGRLGGILAPFYSYAEGAISWVPAVVVGTCAIMSGLLTFILPETRTRPLFQTIAHMDDWEKQRKQTT